MKSVLLIAISLLVLSCAGHGCRRKAWQISNIDKNLVNNLVMQYIRNNIADKSGAKRVTIEGIPLTNYLCYYQGIGFTNNSPAVIAVHFYNTHEKDYYESYKSLAIMEGGYPHYFNIWVDLKSSNVVYHYASPE